MVSLLLNNLIQVLIDLASHFGVIVMLKRLFYIDFYTI